MPVYQVKFIGWEPIQANTPEEALEKFDALYMQKNMTINDLRWKSTQVESTQAEKTCKIGPRCSCRQRKGKQT